MFKCVDLETGEINDITMFLFDSNELDHKSNMKEPIDMSHFNIIQVIGYKDIDGCEIKPGDLLLTDEADWVGIVVWREVQPDESKWILIDTRGGYSLYPNWNKCQILNK